MSYLPVAADGPAVDQPTVDRGALLPGVGRLAVVQDAAPGSPHWPAAVDAAVGTALLSHVAADPTSSTGWLRLYRPAPTVGFSTRDSRSPGFPDAAKAAAAQGFTPLVRAPGGHAAAYHSGCLCFDLVVPDPAGRVDVVAQLEQWGHLLTAVLRSLGADAELGPVPNEYCPGRFSVHAGEAKLVGTAGRRRPGAALVGGVIVVDDADPLRAVIGAVYPALELPCDVSTVGSLTDAIAPDHPTRRPGAPRPVSVSDVASVLLAALEPLVPLSFSHLPDQVITQAHAAAASASPAEPPTAERETRA